MLSGGEPFKSRCYDGQGLEVDGCQPLAMDDGIAHRANPSPDSGQVSMMCVQHGLFCPPCGFMTNNEC